MPKYVVDTRGFVHQEGVSTAWSLRITLNTGSSYFLGCCGLAGLESFSLGKTAAFDDWQDKAEFLACLYRHLYTKGTVVYTLTQTQLGNCKHLALLEIGAQQIAEFPNLYHGPNMMHMFKVNIRNVAGRFCNPQGIAYATPPKNDSEIIPEQTGPGIAGRYADLPR